MPVIHPWPIVFAVSVFQSWIRERRTLSQRTRQQLHRSMCPNLYSLMCAAAGGDALRIDCDRRSVCPEGRANDEWNSLRSSFHEIPVILFFIGSGCATVQNGARDDQHSVFQTLSGAHTFRSLFLTQAVALLHHDNRGLRGAESAEGANTVTGKHRGRLILYCSEFR